MHMLPVLYVTANTRQVLMDVAFGNTNAVFGHTDEAMAEQREAGKGWVFCSSDEGFDTTDLSHQHSGGVGSEGIPYCDTFASELKKLGCAVFISPLMSIYLQRALKSHGILVLQSEHTAALTLGSRVSILDTATTLVPYASPSVYVNVVLENGDLNRESVPFNCTLPYDVTDLLWHRCGSAVNMNVERRYRMAITQAAAQPRFSQTESTSDKPN
jgi:hypothetical protein